MNLGVTEAQRRYSSPNSASMSFSSFSLTYMTVRIGNITMVGKVGYCRRNPKIMNINAAYRGRAQGPEANADRGVVGDRAVLDAVERPGCWPLTFGNVATSVSARVEFEPVLEAPPSATFDIGLDADRTMIRSARNRQQDDPERTGFPPRTERYCHCSGRE
jgi:hypothetical protein